MTEATSRQVERVLHAVKTLRDSLNERIAATEIEPIYS